MKMERFCQKKIIFEKKKVEIYFEIVQLGQQCEKGCGLVLGPILKSLKSTNKNGKIFK